MMHYGRMLLLVFFVSAFLMACGQKKEGANTQVVAKVNGDEISVHLMNYEMARLGNIPQGKEDEAGKQVLKGLVDQQLLVKQALAKKLDRNPNVLQMIDSSKRQILAQAYLDQLVQQLTKPTDAEIHDYYVKSPELFSHRRIYKFAEIALASTVKMEKIEQLISGTKNLEGFAGKLRKENIGFKTISAIKAAEELPLALLPKFSKMAKGEIAIIPTGDNQSVLQLQDFKEQPLTEEQAKSIIANYLFEQKRMALFESEMKKMRDEAKIEYLGAYADPGKGQKNTAVTQSAPAASPAPMKDNHVEKGIAGLK